MKYQMKSEKGKGAKLLFAPLHYFKAALTIAIMLIMTLYCAAQTMTPDSEEYRRQKEEALLQKGDTGLVPTYKGNFLRLGHEEGYDPSWGMVEEEGTLRGTFLMAAPMEEEIFCHIDNPGYDGSVHVLTVGDDLSSGEIQLPFQFNFYGDIYNSVYVNNNGNISFLQAYSNYTSTGFPSNYNMIAPFWADVDTRGANNGRVYYKVEDNNLTVTWYQVGFYNQRTDKVNTFQLIITDGTDATIGIGNNVAFIYGDMQWTTGAASGGANGFGGTPATVGVNKGTGNNSCFFYQVGRFGKAGNEYIGPANISGIDYLDFKCFYYDISSIRSVGADFSYINPYCGTSFHAEIDNPNTCAIKSYAWDFGDGTKSDEKDPVHLYTVSGTYSVKLSVTYECASCDAEIVFVEKQVPVSLSEVSFVESVIDVLSEEKKEVLSFTANTFSDSWTLNYHDPDGLSANSYLNGSQGVWRNEGSYVYNVPRKSSGQVNLSSDGTFDLDYFNWGQAHANAIPHYIKANTVSQYSPYSFELENINALNIPSGAVYDYGGQLPTATGANMKFLEMGYTGFEYMEDFHTGNFIFGNKAFSNQQVFRIISGNNNVVVAQGAPEVFQGLGEIDIVAYSLNTSIFRRSFHNYLKDVEIVCVQEYPGHPERAILILKRFPFENAWIGEIKSKEPIVGASIPDIDGSFGHTGKSSLKIDADKTFPQPLIKLDSGKLYYINVWASNKGFFTDKPLIDGRIGLEVLLKDDKGNMVASYELKPSGSVIEGWQQVQGPFLCPGSELKLELKFKNAASGPAWYDDLRIHPFEGNMQSYVYDTDNFRLTATLDAQNFASLYYYDEEGNLYLVKKETEDGIKSLSENITYIVENKEGL